MTGGNERLTSIVLPVRDQEAFLEPILRGYLAALAPLPGAYELVVVTNACTDRSPEISARLAAEEPSVVHVDLEAGGWGRSVKARLRAPPGDLPCYTNAARPTRPILPP